MTSLTLEYIQYLCPLMPVLVTHAHNKKLSIVGHQFGITHFSTVSNYLLRSVLNFFYVFHDSENSPVMSE